MKALDRSGQPRCAQCCDVDDRDPISVIHSVVAQLDPRVDITTIAAVVDRSCRQRAYQQRLAWAIKSDPALLTGDGHRAPLRVIPRFIKGLHATAIAGIVLPTCPGCHRIVRIDKSLGGVRVCRTCIAHSRIEECSRCRARREPATRDQHGHPICADCFITDPANLKTCIGCGRRRTMRNLPHDRAPWCPTCQHRTTTCSECAQLAAIAAGTLTRPLCAACAPPPTWLDCPTCSDANHPKTGQCERCLINRRLDKITGAPL